MQLIYSFSHSESRKSLKDLCFFVSPYLFLLLNYFPQRTLMQSSFLVFVPPQEQLNSILSWILHSGFHPQQQRLPTHGYNENNIWPFSRCSWFHGATQSVHVVPGISIKCKRQRSHRQMHNGSTPRNGNGIPQEGTLFSKQSIRMRVTRRIMRKF